MTKLTIILALVLAASAAQAKKKPPHPHPPAKHPPPAAPAPPPAPAPTPPPEAAPAPPVDAPPPPPPPPTAPAPAPAPEAKPAAPKIDIDALNTEYQNLRDELFRSRAKVELLGTALYKTRLAVSFQYKAQRAWPLKRVTLKLDDQPVYAADAPPANEPIRVYEGFAAPGHHTVVVHVDCAATGESRVAYGADGSFSVDVPDGKQSFVALLVDESGDGPGTIARKHQGVFDVRVRAEVVVQELGK